VGTRTCSPAAFWLAAAAACHVVVFSLSPLLHAHGCPLCGSRCAPRAAASVASPGPLPGRPHGSLCLLMGCCRPAGGSRGDDDGTAGVRGTCSGAGGVCLACLYLLSVKSPSPLDAGATVTATTGCAVAYPPASDVSPRCASFEYPARAPPGCA
jgi:hypothetical protein